MSKTNLRSSAVGGSATPPQPELSAEVDPATLAEQFALDEIEDRLLIAEAAGDPAAAEHYRRAWMWSAAGDLALFQRSVDRWLELLMREREWSAWRDEGAVAWRLRVEWHDGSAARFMTWWLREGELGYEMMADHVDSELPTPFARRTLRTVPHTRHGLKQAERLILTAIG